MARIYHLQPWDMTRLKRPELRAVLAHYDELRRGANDG